MQHKTTYFPAYIACVCVYIYIYIHTYIYIYTHTHTHTYIYAATNVLETTCFLSDSHKLSASWSNLYHYVLLETELKFIKMIITEYGRPRQICG